jgi:rubrerythrin
MIEEIIRKINDDEINEIKNELIEKYIYNKQAEKFEGMIVIILNDLAKKEEKHAFYLSSLIRRIGVKPAEITEKKLREVPKENIKKSIQFDVEDEKKTIKMYQNAINKSSSINVKAFLEHIKNEENNHLNTLNDYLNQK